MQPCILLVRHFKKLTSKYALEMIYSDAIATMRGQSRFESSSFHFSTSSQTVQRYNMNSISKCSPCLMTLRQVELFLRWSIYTMQFMPVQLGQSGLSLWVWSFNESIDASGLCQVAAHDSIRLILHMRAMRLPLVADNFCKTCSLGTARYSWFYHCCRPLRLWWHRRNSYPSSHKYKTLPLLGH